MSPIRCTLHNEAKEQTGLCLPLYCLCLSPRQLHAEVWTCLLGRTKAAGYPTFNHQEGEKKKHKAVVAALLLHCDSHPLLWPNLLITRERGQKGKTNMLCCWPFAKSDLFNQQKISLCFSDLPWHVPLCVKQDFWVSG